LTIKSPKGTHRKRIEPLEDAVGEAFYPSPQPLSHKGRGAKIQGQTAFANSIVDQIPACIAITIDKRQEFANSILEWV
jgi:hypothetical protein